MQQAGLKSVSARLRRRLGAVRRIGVAAVVLGMPIAALAQGSHLAPFEDGRGLPAGVKINSVSAYFGGFDLSIPAAGAPGTASSSLGTVFGGGWSADVGWYVPGRRTEAFLDYRIAYDGNWKYSGLNGFDHSLTFGVKTKLAPRVTVALDGAAESSTFASFLYGTSRSLALSQQSTSLDQLGGGLAGSIAPVGITQSPLDLTLFGSRRRDASGGVTVTFSQSPRLSWHVSTRALRSLPTSSLDALGGSVVYSGVTSGLVAGGFTYSLSRRTEIGLDAEYARSYSSYERIQIASGSASLDRVLGRQWFLHLRGGVGALSELQSVVQAPVRREYFGDAGIGTKVGGSTFVATVRRSIADSYGLGAANTTGSEIAWVWHRPNGSWTVESSVAYERLAGRTISVIQGWLGTAAVTRRISRQTSLVAQAVYASDSGHYSAGGFTSLMRRGVRLSFIWTPGLAATR